MFLLQSELKPWLRDVLFLVVAMFEAKRKGHSIPYRFTVKVSAKSSLGTQGAFSVCSEHFTEEDYTYWFADDLVLRLKRDWLSIPVFLTRYAFCDLSINTVDKPESERRKQKVRHFKASVSLLVKISWFWDFPIWNRGQTDVTWGYFLTNMYIYYKHQPNKNCFHWHTKKNYESPLLISLMLMSRNYVTSPSLPFTWSWAGPLVGFIGTSTCKSGTDWLYQMPLPIFMEL